MRTLLAVLVAVGTLFIGATSAYAATNNPVAVGPNAKLSSDKHSITLAFKIKCKSNAALDVLAKAKQGSTIGSGKTTAQCKNGTVVSGTVDAKDSAHEFALGKADACVAATKTGSKQKPKPVCGKVKVIA